MVHGRNIISSSVFVRVQFVCHQKQINCSNLWSVIVFRAFGFFLLRFLILECGKISINCSRRYQMILYSVSFDWHARWCHQQHWCWCSCSCSWWLCWFTPLTLLCSNNAFAAVYIKLKQSYVLAEKKYYYRCRIGGRVYHKINQHQHVRFPMLLIHFCVPTKKKDAKTKKAHKNHHLYFIWNAWNVDYKYGFYDNTRFVPFTLSLSLARSLWPKCNHIFLRCFFSFYNFFSLSHCWTIYRPKKGNGTSVLKSRPINFIVYQTAAHWIFVFWTDRYHINTTHTLTSQSFNGKIDIEFERSRPLEAIFSLSFSSFAARELFYSFPPLFCRLVGRWW